MAQRPIHVITSRSCPHCSSWRRDPDTFTKKWNGQVEEMPIERPENRRIAEAVKASHVPFCAVPDKRRKSGWRKCSAKEELAAGLDPDD
jgi:hypothetical protein